MSYTVRCDLYVFSAHAEVVLIIHYPQDTVKRILRARGGSSPRSLVVEHSAAYSPRTRR